MGNSMERRGKASNSKRNQSRRIDKEISDEKRERERKRKIETKLLVHSSSIIFLALFARETALVLSLRGEKKKGRNMMISYF